MWRSSEEVFCWRTLNDMNIISPHTHRQTEFLERRLDKRCVLCENLLQVSSPGHVSQNCRGIGSNHRTTHCDNQMENCVWQEHSYLFERVWRLNLCPRRASCETYHALSGGRKPGSPRRGRRPLGKLWSCLPTYKHTQELSYKSTGLNVSSGNGQCASNPPWMRNKVIRWHFHHLSLRNVL